MIKIARKYIHLISRYSNWSEKGVSNTLQENVYNDADSWKKFLEMLFLALGVAFTTAGILFFFAYNWADLHKFVKLGLVVGLVISLISIILFTNVNENIKNIILTGTSVLIGVLFAVYGQIYQTGANAYDLFFGWTLSITLWAIVANFTPLWLVFITLVNITLYAYAYQVADDWSDIFVYGLLFVVNSGFLTLALVGSKFIEGFEVDNWLKNLLAIVAVSLATLGIVQGIWGKRPAELWVLIGIALILYIAGYRCGSRNKKGIFLAIIPLSVVVILSAVLVKISDTGGMFLVISLLVIISVTLIVKNLIHHQKEWNNE